MNRMLDDVVELDSCSEDNGSDSSGDDDWTPDQRQAVSRRRRRGGPFVRPNIRRKSLRNVTSRRSKSTLAAMFDRETLNLDDSDLIQNSDCVTCDSPLVNTITEKQDGSHVESEPNIEKEKPVTVESNVPCPQVRKTARRGLARKEASSGISTNISTKSSSGSYNSSVYSQCVAQGLKTLFHSGPDQLAGTSSSYRMESLDQSVDITSGCKNSDLVDTATNQQKVDTATNQQKVDTATNQQKVDTATNQQKVDTATNQQKVDTATEGQKMSCEVTDVVTRTATCVEADTSAPDFTTMTRGSHHQPNMETPQKIRSPTPPPETSKRRRGKAMNKKLNSALRALNQAKGLLEKRTPVKRKRGKHGKSELDVILVGEGEEKLEMVVKVRYLTTVHRLTMKVTDTFQQLVRQLSGQLQQPQHCLALYLGDRALIDSDSPRSVQLSVADIIECHLLQATDEVDQLRLIVQGSGKKRETIVVNKRQPLSELMKKYAGSIGADWQSLKFSFDGDDLDPNDTASGLQMEEDDVVDVVAR